MAKKPTKPSKPRIVRNSARKTAKVAPARETKSTKQSLVLSMLRRANGATIDDIVKATDWQPHSVRGFISGALKKRLKIDVVSEKNPETGERRYHVAAIKS